MSKTFRETRKQFESRSGRYSDGSVGWPTILALMAMAVVGAPMILVLLNRWYKKLKGEPLTGEKSRESVRVFAKALHTFRGEVRDDLKFSAGDIIEVIDRPSDQWWAGEIVKGPFAGIRGLFPANYVEVIPKKKEQNESNIEEILDNEDDLERQPQRITASSSASGRTSGQAVVRKSSSSIQRPTKQTEGTQKLRQPGSSSPLVTGASTQKTQPQSSSRITRSSSTSKLPPESDTTQTNSSPSSSPSLTSSSSSPPLTNSRTAPMSLRGN